MAAASIDVFPHLINNDVDEGSTSCGPEQVFQIGSPPKPPSSYHKESLISKLTKKNERTLSELKSYEPLSKPTADDGTTDEGKKCETFKLNFVCLHNLHLFV